MVIDYFQGARLFCHRRLFRAAAGTYHFGTKRLRPLTGDAPDAAGVRMKQENFVRLDFIGLAQQIKYCQAFLKCGGRLFKGDSVR